MDVALMKVGRESPRPITAVDLQRQYGAQVPRGIRFTCPNCGQPVKPCAMSKDGYQSPHFRHKQNNEKAKQCDLYASGYGGYLGWEYQRVPLPMFIHKALRSNDHFVVEGGFRSIDQSILALLAEARAQLVTRTKRYDVNSRRFGSGLTRIPFEDISLTPSDNIELVGSPMRFEEIWNPPEDASRAMVFTCDPDTFQGKRLRSGESACAGSSLFLLAPKREEEAIKKAFGDSKRVGFAGSFIGTSKLQVFQVKLSLEGSKLDKEATYLGLCDIHVSDPHAEPELLWPPSLTGDGSIRPLFSGSSCIFGMHVTRPDSYTYVSEDPSSIRRASPRMLSSTDGRTYKCLLLEPSRMARLVLAASDTSEGSVLLDACHSDVMDYLTDDVGVVRIDDSGDTTIIKAESQASVFWLRKGRAWEHCDLDNRRTRYECAIADGDLVRIVKRLANSRWSLTVWEHDPIRLSAVDSPDCAEADVLSTKRGILLESLYPMGKRIAKARLSGNSAVRTTPMDKEFALKRSYLK